MQWNIFIVVMFQENISCLLTVEIVQRSSHHMHVRTGVRGLQCIMIILESISLFTLFCLITTKNFFGAAQCEETFFL